MSFFTEIRTKKRQRRSWNKVKSRRRRRDSFDIRSRISLTFKMKGRRSLGLARGGICTFLCTHKHTQTHAHTHTHTHTRTHKHSVFPHTLFSISRTYTRTKTLEKGTPPPPPFHTESDLRLENSAECQETFSSLRCKQSTAKCSVICRSLTTLPTTSLAVKWRRNWRPESHCSTACRAAVVRRHAPRHRDRLACRRGYADAHLAVDDDDVLALTWSDVTVTVQFHLKVKTIQRLLLLRKFVEQQKTKKFWNIRNEYWNCVKFQLKIKINNPT